MLILHAHTTDNGLMDLQGLYLSYDACTSDPFIEKTCKYQEEGECPPRNPPMYVVPEARLVGTTSVVASMGKAIFTDLATTVFTEWDFLL